MARASLTPLKALTVGFIAATLVPLWWWALFGMSENVAAAWWGTDGLFAMALVMYAVSRMDRVDE